jgi:hypothetical protein
MLQNIAEESCFSFLYSTLRFIKFIELKHTMQKISSQEFSKHKATH